MAGLLNGVRVVETGVLMAVDNLGRLLGDEGADVVKVEAPGTGDYLRDIMVRFAPGWSAFHVMLNRNKRSVTVDARTIDGQEIVHRLVRDADVFITGNVGRTNEKLGLDYRSISLVNPSIVYCQVTGYGASGPYAEIPTHGQMMEALGGGGPHLTVANGDVVESGTGTRPSSGGVVLGPLTAAFGVAAALVRRHRTGEGSFLDVSCADSVLAAQWIDALRLLNADLVDPDGPTAGGPASAKYQFYETADGKFLLFCAIEAKFWDHFCRAIGRDDLSQDHRRDLVVDFGRGDEQLRHELRDIFRTRTLEDWMAVAREHDVAMGPALPLDQTADDPHLIARNVIVTEHHPVIGDIRTLGSPLGANNDGIRSAPALGQHTDEVLESIGYDHAARRALRDAGVV